MELQSDREQIDRKQGWHHVEICRRLSNRGICVSQRVNESRVAESPASTASRAERLDDMCDCDRDAGDADDEVTEYDSSSDDEETETDVLELNRGSTFLLGTTTRFRRQVRINSWLIS